MSTRRCVVLTFFIFALLYVTAAAQQPTAGEKYFTNTELVDQNGNKLKFYQDVMKGKVVVINTFHTDCKSITVPINSTLKKMQDALAARIGKELFFVSITVDAANDTPAVVSDYAKQVQPKAGWLFLTGTKENVSTVLKKLGQYVENKEDHTSILLIGNDRTGLWKKAFALAKPEDVQKVIESVIADGK